MKLQTIKNLISSEIILTIGVLLEGFVINAFIKILGPFKYGGWEFAPIVIPICIGAFCLGAIIYIWEKE